MIRKVTFALMIILVTMAQAAAGPSDTEKALNLLLAASTMTIPPQSSCQGDYGQQGKPKVKDVLAMELAGFNRGKNTIVGSCQGPGPKSCEILIRHEFGEDAYSAQIHFLVRKGAVDINTLSCVITP